MLNIDGSRLGRRRSVVFVDDNQLLCKWVRRSLAPHARQLELAIFDCADDALIYVRGHAVDLVVLDVFMLGMTGIDACRSLRTTDLVIPIAIATVDLTAEIERAAYDAGATYALEKPINLVDFITTVTGTDLLQIAAHQRLVFENLELARNIANRLVGKYASMLATEDIHGRAMLGLCEAAARYDPARSEPFVAFAARRIRGAVLDQIRSLGARGRVSYKRQRKISGARRALRQSGAEPTDDRVAQQLGLSVATVRDASVDLRNSVVDVAALPSLCVSPDVQVERAQGTELLMRARQALPEPEASVIRLHYDAGKSLAEIAGTIGLALHEVSQIHARAVAMLQAGVDEARPAKRSARAWARRTSIAPLAAHLPKPRRGR